MKHRGLYVEDEISLAESIIQSLEEKNLKITHTDSVREAITLIKKKSFDFYIFDIGLSDGEGYEIAEFLNSINNKKPVLFLTARSESKDRLRGYELGAVEYIPKPFLFKELWIRLEHVLEDHLEPESIDFGDLKIDLESYAFKWTNTDETIFLSAKEFKVFLYLYENSNTVVRRSDLLDHVWGKENYPTERTIDNIILKLRQHLKHYGEYIRSVRGVGYQWLKENK